MIGIIGDTETGKSTLLNALLGEPLLPQNYKPCTSVIANAKLVDRAVPLLTYVWEGANERVEGTTGIHAQIQTLNEEMLRKSGLATVVDLSLWARGHPAFDEAGVCDGSLTLVDMPDLDETGSPFVNTCLEHLLVMCHGLLVVVKCDSIKSDSLAVMVDRISRLAPHLLSTPGAVTFVISLVDTLLPDDANEGLDSTTASMNTLKRTLKKYLANRDCLLLYPGFLSDVRVVATSVNQNEGDHEFNQLIEVVTELHRTSKDLRLSRKLKIADGIMSTFRGLLAGLFERQTYPDRAKQVLKACTAVSAVSFLVTIPLGGWGLTVGCDMLRQKGAEATLGGVPVVGGSVLGAVGAEEANKGVKFDVSAQEIREGVTYEDTLVTDNGLPLYIGTFRGNRPDGRGRLFWPSTNHEAFIGEFVGGFPRDGTFFDERGFFVAHARVGADGKLELGVQPDDLAWSKIATLDDVAETKRESGSAVEPLKLQDWLGDVDLSDTPSRSEGAEELMVLLDNSLYNSGSYGIIYRLSKDLEDKDAEQLAEWGSCVFGVDEGDGWFRVGSLYLPVQLGGVPVLTPVNHA
jgi:hypothetical protein